LSPARERGAPEAQDPAEINLPRAHPVRVLAQLRFPGILKIENKGVVAVFQEQIRRDYPLFEQQPMQRVLWTHTGGNRADPKQV
jgi:uncharacterized protein (TIGR04255 family)